MSGALCVDWYFETIRQSKKQDTLLSNLSPMQESQATHENQHT